jgi:hypothetical protein
MVSRIFFCRTVRLLGARAGWALRELALPPVACAAMFANAFPIHPAAVAAVTGNFRPELSDPPDQLPMNEFTSGCSFPQK